MADLPLAPGQPYVEVEYDYEYNSKGRLVSICTGDCFLLVKKTNEDWWQVRRDDGSKAFYVPAQYVREVRKALMPPRHPPSAPGHAPCVPAPSVPGYAPSVPTSSVPGHAPSVPAPGPPPSLWVKPAALELPPDALSSRRSSSSLRDVSPLHSPTSGSHSGLSDAERGPEPQACVGRSSSTLARSRGRSPELQREPLDVDSHHQGESGDELRSHESESDLSSSSTEQLQVLKQSGALLPPLPPPPSRAPLSSCSGWDTHRDPSGRLFYVNQNTQERTWKPPRAREQSAAEEPAVTLQCPESPTGAPRPPSSLSEKCGLLNVTKITENGKRVRKNWTSSWTVLQGSTLLFTKGQAGGSSWFGGQSKPELTLDLRGATVDWAQKDRSSKKNVLELKMHQGTEVLIQSDNEDLIKEWLHALHDCISMHAWESDEGMDDELPESPTRDEKNDKEHRHSKKDKNVKNSGAEVSEHKTKHKLRKFLTRRPTLQAVRDKGYIKDQVFGCSLSSLCQRENSTVPHFVRLCIEHVETNGLRVDGLYRVSGNLAVIQKLRFAINHDEKVNLCDGKWEDIHVTTGALKMFFRELPEPLFPYALFYDFINAIKSPDYRQRVQSIKDLIRQLPKASHDTMQVLFRHLRRVVDHGDDNRMTIQSVAIVFGPTLLRPETETWNMAVHMVYQNQIVELILIECEGIFGR